MVTTVLMVAFIGIRTTKIVMEDNIVVIIKATIILERGKDAYHLASRYEKHMQKI